MLRQSIFAAIALAAGAVRAEGYEPKGLLTTGYFEHRHDDGTWFVGANSRQHEGFAAAERIALYRAAALARQEGHRYVQILRVRTQRLTNRATGTELTENTHLEVRFADTADAPADCRQPKNYRDQCRTFDGGRILLAYWQEMGDQPPVLPPDLQAAVRRSAPTPVADRFLPAPAAAPRPVPAHRKVYPGDDTVQTPL